MNNWLKFKVIPNEAGTLIINNRRYNIVNKEIELLNKKIEAQDKIINTQALEIAHLNLQLDQALKDYEELLIKIDKANELLSKIVVREREDGNWGAVKNTSKQDVYKTIWKLYEILDTSSYERNEMLKILGDKNE